MVAETVEGAAPRRPAGGEEGTHLPAARAASPCTAPPLPRPRRACCTIRSRSSPSVTSTSSALCTSQRDGSASSFFTSSPSSHLAGRRGVPRGGGARWAAAGGGGPVRHPAAKRLNWMRVHEPRKPRAAPLELQQELHMVFRRGAGGGTPRLAPVTYATQGHACARREPPGQPRNACMGMREWAPTQKRLPSRPQCCITPSGRRKITRSQQKPAPALCRQTGPCQQHLPAHKRLPRNQRQPVNALSRPQGAEGCPLAARPPPAAHSGLGLTRSVVQHAAPAHGHWTQAGAGQPTAGAHEQ